MSALVDAPERVAAEVDRAGPGGAVRAAPAGGPARGATRSRLAPLLGVLRDANGANVAAGLTAGLWYAFGAVPLHLDAAASLRLAPEAASSWFFIIFVTSALSSIALTLRFRQPLAVGWTIPGLVLLSTAGRPYTHAELGGAAL